MNNGYVLGFTDRTFGEFFASAAGVEIHSDKYGLYGPSPSKANKLRAFWDIESDSLVGTVLLELIRECKESSEPKDLRLIEMCQSIANRLLAGGPNLAPLNEIAIHFNAPYLKDQISRLESSIEPDPALAIGTAKELIETVCKTILAKRGIFLSDNPDIPELTKATFKELKLTRDDIPDASKEAETIKRILSNLGSIAGGLAELRNLHGTGHGKPASTLGPPVRHARLAAGVVGTLVWFLFESYQEQEGRIGTQPPSDLLF